MAWSLNSFSWLNSQWITRRFGIGFRRSQVRIILERGIGLTKVIEAVFFHEIFDFFESSMKTSEILHHGLGCGKI
jgi:hypothetical protein